MEAVYLVVSFRVGEDAHDDGAENGAEPPRRVQRPLYEAVPSRPVPVVDHAGGRVGLVEFDANDKGYIWCWCWLSGKNVLQ